MSTARPSWPTPNTTTSTTASCWPRSMPSTMVLARRLCYARTQAATAAEFASCVPLNAFGPTASSPAALAYIIDTTHFTAWTKQDNLMAHITGSPFATWAGDVKVALSGEWRHQTYRSTSDADTVAIGAAACTNLRFACNPTSTQGWFQTFPNRSTVSQSVTEAALEANVPLLKDSAIGDHLDLTGARAGRITTRPAPTGPGSWASTGRSRMPSGSAPRARAIFARPHSTICSPRHRASRQTPG